MSKRMTNRDREEFEGFCRQATDFQLRNIHEKEKSDGRRAYAEIARREMTRRGLA